MRGGERCILDVARVARDRVLMSATLAEGTIFARRYRIVRPLAAGAMGSVYEAVHLETDRRRALKVMHQHLFQSDEMRDRFKREARIAAHIESEHIVDVSDAGVDEATGMPFLVMELLRGEDLGQRLKRVGRLSFAEVLLYLQQIAPALDRTHAASIVHRDLKPANLFLTQREDGSPRVKILDFGVAKLVAEGATAAGATRSLGTPLYMAPEQFRAGAKLSAAADIYALGMIAYTLLVGEPYWTTEANSARDVIAFAMIAIRGPQESTVQRAAARGVTLPPAFDPWFARVTAAEPTARFRAATEAVHALREALERVAGAEFTATAPLPPMLVAITPALATPLPVAIPAGRVAMGSGRGSSPHLPDYSSTPAAGVSAGRHRSSPQLFERVATSTEAAVSAVPSVRNRSPAVAAAALLSLAVMGMLSAGTWWVLGSRSGGSTGTAVSAEAEAPVGPAPPATTATASTVSSATVAMAPAVEASPSAAASVAAAGLSAATATASPGPVTGTGARTGASVRVSSAAGSSTKTGTKPPAQGSRIDTPAMPKRPIDKLLGQD